MSKESRVGVIMGSDSDLPVMKKALRIFDEFGVPYEVTVASAHRTPDKAVKLAQRAEEKGWEAIVCGAGGAAHLPGVLAAHTLVPVIGVPLKAWATDGVDALYSMVQMPGGIPVATVGINRAKNGALLAIQIMATCDEELAEKLRRYRREQAERVEAIDSKLKRLGPEKYSKAEEE